MSAIDPGIRIPISLCGVVLDARAEVQGATIGDNRVQRKVRPIRQRALDGEKTRSRHRGARPFARMLARWWSAIERGLAANPWVGWTDPHAISALTVSSTMWRIQGRTSSRGTAGRAPTAGKL